MGALSARDLSFAYASRPERPALRGVSFELAPGRCLLVVGPSGSGKSTLALAIAGLVPREIPGTVSGSVRLDGSEIRSIAPPALASRVGIVFQDPASQLVMERVEDDVAFGLENRGWPRERMRARVPESLAEVGLAGLELRRSTRLSGGQQQRLALAGVLAPRPRVLVLDEPTANLDPDGATTFFARLAALRSSRSTTIVLVEHRVDAAWPLADLVLALDGDGSPIDLGAPGDVLSRSRTRMTEAGIWMPDEPARGRRTDPGTPGETLVEAVGVEFGYDRRSPVVHDVDLALAAGERVALVGPNGSGKSTLGRLLVGLLAPQRGRVLMGSGSPSRLPAAELARRAGYVFQEPERQFLADRVTDEVALGLRAGELARVADLMDRLRLPLDKFGDRSPYRLSGGEQRRLSLACVLVRRPALLVLDEPTFGQDRLGHEALVAILDERLAAGTCVVAATHDERFVADVADRVIALDRGRVIRDGPLQTAG
ncbi:MAG TPA: ATP-binding cassette domain-containing protein [Candidatus Dormibacteraeota bacterium]|nr:ATP-binding cassette domain-containing protein [Candidatus Dormibacteraeota bacterium]